MSEITSKSKHYEYTDRWGDPISVFFTKAQYAVGDGLCVDCYCETTDEDDGEVYVEPYTPITVNFGEPTEPDVAFVDANNSGHIIDWMIGHGLASPTGHTVQSGFCSYPSVRFSKDFLDGLIDVAELLQD